MQLIIHRGTHEIGGSCVEISTKKTRILIDFGMSLVNAKEEKFDSKELIDKSIEELKKSNILLNIKGLYNNGEKAIDGILISHAHMDHYGLLNYVHKDIPIYMSKGADELIKISSIFTPNKLSKINSKIINKKYFNIGDIKVTPYLVDHSAFDALAFLIEASGKRLFYSGDFRGHGRKRTLFNQILENPPKDIDCLLMEGSMLGRGDQKYEDEAAIEKKIAGILKSANSITFLFASSQNIDRLVSAYKACLRTSSIFVIDIYIAYILDRLRKVSKHIPQFNWRNIRIKFYKDQADTLANKVSTQTLYYYNTKKIDIEELKRKKSRILMLSRDNSIFPRIVKELDNIEGARIVYSMWDGYLKPDFEEYCAKKGLIIEKVHTSGHATIDDLKAFSDALKPGVLIPIHTFEAERYPGLFQNVKLLKDGEVFLIS